MNCLLRKACSFLKLAIVNTHSFYRVLVPLAEGFEEMEAITTIDVLRRAEVHVTVATLHNTVAAPIRASRRTQHLADEVLDDVLDSYFHAIALPGGRPGADYLRVHTKLLECIQKNHAEGRLIAAICAAPLALESAGVLADQTFTIHPSAAKDLRKLRPLHQPLVVYKNIITAQAAAHSMSFALEIVRRLCGEETMQKVASALMAAEPQPYVVS